MSAGTRPEAAGLLAGGRKVWAGGRTVGEGVDCEECGIDNLLCIIMLVL